MFNPDVTLDDIARKAGLSKGAVSLALRGKPGVSENTRKRVQTLAKEMGYQPDPAISALSQRRWRDHRKMQLNWAFITDEFENDASFQAYFSTLKQSSEASGYDVTPILLKPGMRARELNRQLNAMTIHGILLNRITQPEFRYPQWWEGIDFDKYAWVMINESREAPPVHRVINNAFSNTQKALEQMQAIGYSRIAFLHESDILSRENQRQHAAFLQFQMMQKEQTGRIFDITPNAPLDQKTTQEILDFKPQALLLGYTGIHKFLPDSLKTIPSASMAIWDNFRPEFSGIHLNTKELIEISVEMLDFQVRRRERGLPSRRHTLLVDGEWKEGQSLPPLNKNS